MSVRGLKPESESTSSLRVFEPCANCRLFVTPAGCPGRNRRRASQVILFPVIISESIIDPPAMGEFPLDELFRLELRIARRADELTLLREREAGYGYWETAEREVLPESLRQSA